MSTPFDNISNLFRPTGTATPALQEADGTLKKGDKVVTVGGIYGEITAIKDDELTLRVADKVEIRVARSGIGRAQS